MALVDPYSPCPCGSGQKFKWCCQKVEAHAEKAGRLYEGGQVDAALEALDEGLRKVPDNPWLLVRKALILSRQEQPERARPLLERVVAKDPGHAGANALLIQVVMETEGPAAGVAQLQRALTACAPEARPTLASFAQLVGMLLSRDDHVPAALKHLTLAAEMGLADDPTNQSAVSMLEADPNISLWLRNPYELSPPPDGLAAERRERFAQALDWAGQGLWSSAASAFDTLGSDGDLAEADRNLGLCRLWLADDAGAVEALRRFIHRAGSTTEAVDLEAVCQVVAPTSPNDQMERVQWIWPLRDREGLLNRLREHDRIVAEGEGTIDPDDPDSPQVDQFTLLDRRPPGPDALNEPEDIPRVLARVLVGREIAALDGFDDGRLDATSERFTELAGPTIPPAHPRTKVIGHISRSTAILVPDFWLPRDADPIRAARWVRQEEARRVREVWPQTPMPYLGGRTPARAAQDGDAQVALSAAIAQLESSRDIFGDEVDFNSLRATLGLGPEPEIDPRTVDIARVHLARLDRISADRLDDDQLVSLYQRARGAVVTMAIERAARALADRPALLERGVVDVVAVYSDLANLALGRGDTAEAFAWADRGRRADPPARRTQDAPRWDMLEVRLRARTAAPEDWVPHLAIVLERYGDDRSANQVILSNLLDMGLVQVSPNPDHPEGVLLDTRRLTAVLGRYGPRVTTASGGLGVSAAKRADIWTPGGASTGGGGGGIWTPGSGGPAPEAGGKSKLIIPGR